MKLQLLRVGITIFFLSATALITMSQNPQAENHSTRFSTKSNLILVDDDIIIPENDSLVIEPGTVLLFTGHYSIHVKGKLIALGTPTDSIVFTIADTTGFSNIHSNEGGWNGIRFEDTPADSDSSLFAWCRFEYGKAVGDSANRYGGAIRLINFNKVSISNSVFANNYSFFWGGGIYAQKADIAIDQCLFEHNYSGNDSLVFGYGGAICFVSSNPDVMSSTFLSNSSTGIGGGISFEFSNPKMINCIFIENFSALGGALGFLRCSPDRSIANILIQNNSALYFGGGIAMVTASPRMSNLTIVNNHASMGGGYYCNEYSDPKLYNSILWGNTAAGGVLHGSQVWIWDVYSEPGFYHCNVQYGPDEFGGSMFIGQYENNIDSDPLFINPQGPDFGLQQYSPCINSGTVDTTGLLLPDFDLAYNPRIMHGIIDMGAYEYDGPLSSGSQPLSNKNLKVFPNPVSAGSIITFENSRSETITFILRNIHGSLLGTYLHPVNECGKYSLELNKIADINKLPCGIYMLEMNNSGQRSVTKVILNRKRQF
jgi:predicted outer membrane repeat protein